MRSRLLLSVAQLPTIRESSEELLPGGAGQEPPASPSLDDYVRSICQLAQPTCVLDKATAQGRLSRRGRPAQASEETCPDVSLQEDDQHPATPTAGPADPLAWLFGQSQEKQSSERGPARRTGPGAGLWDLRSDKAGGIRRGKPCEVRMFGCSLVRPALDGPQSTDLRNPMAGQHGRPEASSCRPRPSRLLRTLCLHLPVIHEL